MPSSDNIHYFFTLLSPYAYLGHDKLLEIAKRHGKAISYRPIMLMKVWESSGAAPLAQRPPARQRYRLIELQRWREARGLTLNLRPKHFPTNPGLADRAVIALAHEGQDPHAFMARVFRALWAEDLDIADQRLLEELLEASGHDAPAILQKAESEPIIKEYAENTEAGAQLDIIGSPAYVYKKEPFWGQDRLELLDSALTSKREPFHA